VLTDVERRDQMRLAINTLAAMGFSHANRHRRTALDGFKADTLSAI